MEKIGLYIRSVLGAGVTLLLFVITLPLTLFLALASVIFGTIMVLKLKQQYNQAEHKSSASQATQPDRQFGSGKIVRDSTTENGVVIEQVKVNGVWQMP